MKRATIAGGFAVALLSPASAAAHGLAGRADLPVPTWLFSWAAAIVLVLSFMALAVMWPELPFGEATLMPQTVWSMLLFVVGMAAAAWPLRPQFSLEPLK